MIEKIQQPEKYVYKYFEDAKQRHDIYTFCKELTTYLHDNAIPNIVMVDRSPRPAWVGIYEYWDENYKDEPKPKVYFINPKGVDSINKIASTMTPEEIGMDRLMMAFVGESKIVSEADKHRESLVQDFEKRSKQFAEDKDKPVAIFDNCIHSGDTMLPVVVFFHQAGFQDIRILVADDYHNHSDLRIDQSFGEHTKIVACGAFGLDYGVKKGDDIFSEYDPAHREEVVLSRKEIRQIVKDKGN